MAANTGKIQRNESARRIPLVVGSDEWAAELDGLFSDVRGLGQVVDDRGFTVADVASRRGVAYSHAGRIVLAMVAAGKIKQIGVRSAPGRAKVYERN